MYNKIYLFLVGVKHSLWCLQSVSLKQVSRMDQQLEKVNKCSDMSMGVKLPALLGNYDRLTDQTSKYPTDRHEG